MKKNKRKFKLIIAVFLCLLIAGMGTVLGINAYVKHITKKQIFTSEEASKLSDIGCPFFY